MDFWEQSLSALENVNCGFKVQKRIKKNAAPKDSMKKALKRNYAYLAFLSSDTDSFFLPLALRRAITALPPTVDILCLKPCLFVLLRLLGWYVLFMTLIFLGVQN